MKNALAFFKLLCYNEDMDKLFRAEFTNEAFEQLCKLQKSNIADYKKIVKAVAIFEKFGKDACNSRPLKSGLFEIKADQVRAYYKYYENSIIIIGIIVLKKTQKAPERYIEQALNNIERYLKENKE